MMGLILTLLAISACTVSGAPMQPRQAEAAVPDLLDTVATTTTASAAPTESAGVESVSPMAALASSFAQLSPASVIAPAVSVSADTDAASVDARQTVLNLVLAAANHVASSPAMGAMTPSLSALVDAHQAYIQAASSSSGRRDANEVSAAAKAVYIAVLNHAVTSEGTAMVSTLASSNPTYQQADAAAGVNRTDECAQMQQHFQGQLSQIPSVVTTHMCDNSTSYSLARMHLAAYAHNSTQFTESTGDASSIAALAQSVTNGTGVVKDATANLDSGNSWQPNSTSSDRRRGTGFNGYDPATGEISAGVCLGEGFELCLKGGGYLPNFKYLTQSITGADEMMIEQCVGGKCSQVTPLEFASSAAAQAANVGIEVSVSVCLGIPGLIDVLNYLGISLCYNLLVADFYGFQGPLGQLSTGLQLFIVKLSAFGKLKMANASPVCPQDFNSDMMSYACRNQDVYDAFVNQFAGNDYCNLAAGHGLLGASIVLDLYVPKDEMETRCVRRVLLACPDSLRKWFCLFMFVGLCHSQARTFHHSCDAHITHTPSTRFCCKKIGGSGPKSGILSRRPRRARPSRAPHPARSPAPAAALTAATLLSSTVTRRALSTSPTTRTSPAIWSTAASAARASTSLSTVSPRAARGRASSACLSRTTVTARGRRTSRLTLMWPTTPSLRLAALPSTTRARATTSTSGAKARAGTGTATSALWTRSATRQTPTTFPGIQISPRARSGPATLAATTSRSARSSCALTTASSASSPRPGTASRRSQSTLVTMSTSRMPVSTPCGTTRTTASTRHATGMVSSASPQTR